MYGPLIVALLSVGCHKLFDLAPVELPADARVNGDGGSGDGGTVLADAKPARKHVFLVSKPKTGAMGGLVGADAICQELADAAGLSGTFLAWLSTSTVSAASRMTHSTVPYALVGGVVVADNWDDLVDGQLTSPILLTERGEGPTDPQTVCQGAEVWSNTKPDGTWSGDSSCANWTSSTGTAPTGRYSASGDAWTLSECINVTCAFPLPFYCIEQ